MVAAASRIEGNMGEGINREPSFQEEEDEFSGVYSIDVAVRVRPLNSMELADSQLHTVRVMDEKIVVVLDPSKLEGGNEDDYLRAHRSRERRYTFDHVFDETASQQKVYAATTEKLIGGVMEGFNASCFAYGATGAGKTYTMLGNKENPGCMLLTVGELFHRIEDDTSKTYRVYLTYLEVYNENIRDLLNPSTGYLDLREDPVKGICVAGITEFSTTNVGETMELLQRGNLNRTVEPTKKNETSSRSHAVMQIMIEAKEKTADISEQVKIGKLSLIDLAGSERASATDNRGARLVEGANINRSLLALANCINALASDSEAAARAGRNGRRRVRSNFVPYRDSKLTRLLKDSFGGNSRTVMITNVSPAGNQYEETVNTLKYANRAKDIKTKVVQNVVELDAHVLQYQNIIRELRSEVNELKLQLAMREHHVPLPSIGVKKERSGAGSPFEVPRSGSVMSGKEEKEEESVELLNLRKSMGRSGRSRRDVRTQMSEDAQELATRAKGIFKDRARLLRRLIDIEEAIYSSKIDLAVIGVRKRREEEGEERKTSSPSGDEEKDEAELQKQIKEKERQVAALVSKLRENEEAGKEIQLAMKKRIADPNQLERLAMLVKNHILEIQNIELQLRDRAKEQLSHRLLNEVGRNSQIASFLPKIDIARRPVSPSRQLFTPSTRVPPAVRGMQAFGNAAEITSSRVYQLGSRLGSIYMELDEEESDTVKDGQQGTQEASRRSSVRSSVEATDVIVSDVPTVDPVEELKKGDTVRISPARVDKKAPRGGSGNAQQTSHESIQERQIERYRERLQQRQEVLRKQKEFQAAHSDRKRYRQMAERRQSIDRPPIRHPSAERKDLALERKLSDGSERRRFTPEKSQGQDQGLNMDKTEIRNIMKPLQAESQADRLLELQERYNLGKQNAAQKKHVRNKIIRLQVPLL
uniref:Kinesin-like protein n=1 Tax=Guillardia theta TaxID=55529 RepID=A0A6U6BPP1_GUITH|mmetsp:Transcript_39166/g.123460  ORF Transcript_39166/g.123460 Transcript_39166/m.123460 type:complete len:931 (+) Transcript_39166:402-3194(+)